LPAETLVKICVASFTSAIKLSLQVYPERSRRTHFNVLFFNRHSTNNKTTYLQYTIQNIQSIIKAKGTIHIEATIQHLIIDSRKIVFPQTSLFFALASNRRDGHSFIKDVYQRGVRNFVVKKGFDASAFPDANFLFIYQPIEALQNLAAHHRKQFNIPVIGITGSNGKTIVKEWLYQLLQTDFNIVRSPRSYNSQIGVPLSVWQMNETHTLAIFEAGISEQGEMQWLQKIIQPTIGIYTSLGNAHSEGFRNIEAKQNEKWLLFSEAEKVVYAANEIDIPKNFNLPAQTFTWGKAKSNSLAITNIKIENSHTTITASFANQSIFINIPFTDEASINNACTCWATLLMLGYTNQVIAQRIAQLQTVEMRMQLKKGINNCTIINDSYSNDSSSLSIGLDYLQQQSSGKNTTLILSDILQSSTNKNILYQQLANELKERNIHRFIGIGKEMVEHQQLFAQAVQQTSFYTSTQHFLQQSPSFKDEFILLKGARVFAFEQITKWLEQKVHQTVMEINLTAMLHNLNQYQKHLLPSTKIMAMVKAFSYGSGSSEVARLLQFHKVDYLAVAYADEGIELRQAGISLPIMVMNADASTFDALIEHNLEPEIYSFNIYHSFHNFLLQQGITQFPVHIKLNTGMNRLGFDAHEVAQLTTLLQQYNTMFVKTVFSHLVASEAAEHDDFTQHQANIFNAACTQLQNALGYTFIQHLANTAAIFRHPNLQYNMVRLGIGLYGVDSANGTTIHLETVATLKSTIAQIRSVKANETVGYNRNGKLQRDSKIATIRIGYADGFSRKLSNGIGSVYIHDKLAKVVGNVCMDMIMVDVTDIPNVQEEDTVEIFGKHLPVQQIASWCGTISYEILTSINQRVKRIYVEE
jgi:Alr-MurF fusion protein